MEYHALHDAPFVFPNDAHPAWSIMIVIYPYITGMVAWGPVPPSRSSFISTNRCGR